MSELVGMVMLGPGAVTTVARDAGRRPGAFEAFDGPGVSGGGGGGGCGIACPITADSGTKIGTASLLVMSVTHGIVVNRGLEVCCCC